MTMPRGNPHGPEMRQDRSVELRGLDLQVVVYPSPFAKVGRSLELRL
jgi:hypothetical protein